MLKENYNTFVKRIGFFLLFVLMSVIYPAHSIAQSNSCSLGEVNIIDGGAFSVEIVVTNSDTLAGFQIPFSFDYGDIDVTCDSISYIGGDCENFASLETNIAEETKTVYLAVIQNTEPNNNNEPLYPGTHIVARAYFTLADVDQNQNLAFAQTILADEYRDFSLLMWTPEAEEVPCSFDFGSLNIR